MFNSAQLSRRQILQYGLLQTSTLLTQPLLSLPLISSTSPSSYDKPRVIIVRFGGGVRRQETINSQGTYAPFFRHVLCPRGTLFSNMELDSIPSVETSHGQGTLYLLTGSYQSLSQKKNNEELESTVPTLFEYVRKAYQMPEEETLIINGEDRPTEEFFSYSNHHAYGVNYRSQVLSLYRFQTYLLKKQLKDPNLKEKDFRKKTQQLKDLEKHNYRSSNLPLFTAKLEQFWQQWQQYYGESGYLYPRGDRLLTELAIWSLQWLKPKLLMINYNDPDYVHWGFASHYTRAISIIDRELQRLTEVVDSLEDYKNNTIFCIVPDCGRDSNPLLAIPYQHHFNSPSAHQIFALFFGKGIPQNKIVERRVSQIDVAPTLAKMMGIETNYAEGKILEEVFI